jgi:hypothetical protein
MKLSPPSSPLLLYKFLTAPIEFIQHQGLHLKLKQNRRNCQKFNGSIEGKTSWDGCMNAIFKEARIENLLKVTNLQ